MHPPLLVGSFLSHLRDFALALYPELPVDFADEASVNDAGAPEVDEGSDESEYEEEDQTNA